MWSLNGLSGLFRKNQIIQSQRRSSQDIPHHRSKTAMFSTLMLMEDSWYRECKSNATTPLIFIRLESHSLKNRKPQTSFWYVFWLFLFFSKDHQKYFKVPGYEPVSENYYPINSRIMISDSTNSLIVLTDRSHGGSSLNNGTVEVMVSNISFLSNQWRTRDSGKRGEGN